MKLSLVVMLLAILAAGISLPARADKRELEACLSGAIRILDPAVQRTVKKLEELTGPLEPYDPTGSEAYDIENIRVRTAVGLLARATDLNAAQLNGVWAWFAWRMFDSSNKTWLAFPYRGADGSYIWIGATHQMLVISPRGAIYRGEMERPLGAMPENFVPPYDELHPVGVRK